VQRIGHSLLKAELAQRGGRPAEARRSLRRASMRWMRGRRPSAASTCRPPSAGMGGRWPSWACGWRSPTAVRRWFWSGWSGLGRSRPA
jgi:hypothetical protein